MGANDPIFENVFVPTADAVTPPETLTGIASEIWR